MTNLRRATNSDEHDCSVAELEALQTRPTQVFGPRAAVFELPGESSLLMPSGEQPASVPTGSDNIPQANPWPFHLDDASGTLLVYPIRPPGNETSGISQGPANPWPYHGVESDNLDIDNSSTHSEDSSNVMNETISSSDVDEELPHDPGAELLEGNHAIEWDGIAAEQSHKPLLNANHVQTASCLAGTAFQPAESENLAPTHSLGQASTPAQEPSSHNLAITAPGPLGSLNVHRDGTPESLRHAASGAQSSTSRVNEHNGIIPETHSGFDSATAGIQGEHLHFVYSAPHQQIQSQASTEPQHSQPASQVPEGSYSQLPPPYAEEAATVLFESQDVEIHQRRHNLYPHTTDVAQPTTTVLPADASVRRRPFCPEPRLRSEAPPLPPRPSRNNASVVGLSDGPHSKVSFPPPPKRHNVPPARRPPPLPQRPATSSSSSYLPSKFMGSSSAKKWITKTNRAIEDRLEAVLQGPAGHPSRPAYTSLPQKPDRNFPQSSAHLQDQGR